MDTLQEHLLIQRAKTGDKDAISVLYRLWVGKIYGYLMVRLGSKQDAEDITEQVCLKAIKKVKTYREESSFATWIYTIARHTLIDFYRQKKFVSLPFDLADPKPLVDLEDHEVELAKKKQKVAQILAPLPEGYRQILEYRYLRGMSIKDTASSLGLTESNVKVKTLRALEKAKQQYL